MKHQIPSTVTHTVELEDNHVIQMVYGPHDKNLIQMENALGVTIVNRGNQLSITGDALNVENACSAINVLYGDAQQGKDVTPGMVQASVRMTALSNKDMADKDILHKNGHHKNGADNDTPTPSISIKTRRGVITPRTPMQARYIASMQDSDITFGLGSAGTGKTYLGVCQGVEMLLNGDVERIVLSRPAVEAGENLGFLPGDLKEKIDPYLRPIYDALYECLPADQVATKLASGEIEIAPLAFMRGRTLKNAFVLLDEAQNTTPVQIKMFLTRLGYGSRMVINGDLTQVDLPRGQKSGLRDAIEALRTVKDINVIRFSSNDVVRHPLVSSIIDAYDRHHDMDVEKAWTGKQKGTPSTPKKTES